MILKIISLLLMSQLVFAGGWSKKKGKAFFKFESRFLSANQLYQSNGELSPKFGTTRIYTNSLYAEYGISDSFTAILYAPFFQAMTRNNIQYNDSAKTTIKGAENSGIGDVAIGFRYGFKQEGSTVFALRVVADLPTGDGKSETVLYTGDEEFNIGFALELGQSLNNGKAYLTADIGYNFRGEDRFKTDISDEFTFAFEYGIWLTEDLLAAIKSKGVFPSEVKNGISEFGQSQYLAYTFEAFYKLENNFGLTGSFTGAKNVRNYFKSPVYSLGLVYELN